jgi:hypothetical protein
MPSRRLNIPEYRPNLQRWLPQITISEPVRHGSSFPHSFAHDEENSTLVETACCIHGTMAQ